MSCRSQNRQQLNMSAKLAKGDIWQRMIEIIRTSRIPMTEVLRSWDRDRRGYMDVETFKRGLCYAFDKMWFELNMSDEEFEEIRAKYAGRDDRYIMWMAFSE